MTFDDLEHWVHEDVMLENEERPRSQPKSPSY
jgi:hypothetical protein